jgi:hypothetical protein
MWEFFKSVPWTSAIVAVILLAAVTGLIIALVLHLKKKKVKGELMRTPDGGFPLKWPANRLPIGVIFQDALGEGWGSLVDGTCRYLAEVLGVRIFLEGREMGEGYDLIRWPPVGHIFIRMVGKDQLESVQNTIFNGGSVTQHKYDKETGNIRSAVVTLPIMTSESLWIYKAMILHEFGHVLGLKHDGHDQSSIMYPNLKAQYGPGTLSDKDIQVLKTLYK